MLKITEIRGEDSDGCAEYHIRIEQDGKMLRHFYAGCLSECPEDAMLERDLSYAYEAVEFFGIGYGAGKRGEPVEYETKYEEK